MLGVPLLFRLALRAHFRKAVTNYQALGRSLYPAEQSGSAGGRRMGPDDQPIALPVTASRTAAGPRRAVAGTRGRVQRVGPIELDVALRCEPGDDELAVLVVDEIAVLVSHEVGRTPAVSSGQPLRLPDPLPGVLTGLNTQQLMSVTLRNGNAREG